MSRKAQKHKPKGRVFYSTYDVAELLEVSQKQVRRLLSNSELLAGTNVVVTVDHFDGEHYVTRKSMSELQMFFPLHK